MKGIILAGGHGTRLYPITLTISKQLLPIYDKPMIYYPLSVLMLSGIKEILIICTSTDLDLFKNLLGDGSHLGIKLLYKVQEFPNGLAEAFIIGEDFIQDDDVCLILGDNIFYGHSLIELLKKNIMKVKSEGNAVIYGYNVKDPERYGVVEFDKNKKVLSIEEKPSKPKSNLAIVGLYLFTKEVVSAAKKVTPSLRGELEITSVIQHYLDEKKLKVDILGRGIAWLDTGTHETFLEASQFIETIEKRQGLKVACLEEIAYNMGYITEAELVYLAEPYNKNSYGKYLLQLANGYKYGC